MRSVGIGGRQDDHRNHAAGLFLVFGELWNTLSLRAKEALAFLTGRLAGNNRNCLRPHLNRDISLCLEVVVPIRIRRRSTLRSEHYVPPAVGLVRKRIDAALA